MRPPLAVTVTLLLITAEIFQGVFEHLELEMMVAAGMTPMQVLVAATSVAAECHSKGAA